MAVRVRVRVMVRVRVRVMVMVRVRVRVRVMVMVRVSVSVRDRVMVMTTISIWLNGIKERLSKSTPGPWYYYGLCGWLGNVIGTTPEETVIGPPASYPSLGDPDFSTSVIGVNYERFHGKEEDCKLIASSPTDLALAVEVINLLCSRNESIIAKSHSWIITQDTAVIEKPIHDSYRAFAEETKAKIDALLNGQTK